MPADYKYTHISLGRLKALEMATSRFRDLYGELAKSRVIDPAIIERMRVLRVLLQRAADGTIGTSADEQLLDDLLGPHMGDQYQ